MRLHILGICGTFMAGLALIARELGHQVSGSDERCYPPMSTLLEQQGIAVLEGCEPAHLQPPPELVLIGNVLSRGHPLVEHTLDTGLAYTSGPEWLAREVLGGRRVLAVSGTHGKTTTAGMLAWALESCGLAPGFLVGGLPGNFAVSARLGSAPFFIIEADEYDTAFFDKRSKFVHYRPEVLIINGIEYDHADIFPDLAAVERQFHHLIRTVPGRGAIIYPADDECAVRVLEQGCWSRVQSFGGAAGADWRYGAVAENFTALRVSERGGRTVDVRWPLYGEHNARNAAACIAAAAAAGLDPARTAAALATFKTPRRRLERLGEAGGVTVHDDFAHHPTAIRVTLEALRGQVGTARLLAVLEPRSNSMRQGVNRADLPAALSAADEVYILARKDLAWQPAELKASLGDRLHVLTDTPSIVAELARTVHAGDHIVFMSNGGFDDIQNETLTALGSRGR